MPPRPFIPPTLRQAPFRSADALTAGLSREQLRSRCWVRVLRDVYRAAALPDSLELRAQAASLVLPPQAAVVRASAAWLYGVDVPGLSRRRLEIATPLEQYVRSQDALTPRRTVSRPGDMVRVGAITVTSPVRTAFDLARRPPWISAVASLDAMLHAGLLTLEDLSAFLEERRGWPGVRLARAALAAAEPRAESVRETHLRLIVAEHLGLRPLAQVNVYDRTGFIARVDHLLDWVAVEFDGAQHDQTAAADVRRRQRLAQAGIALLSYRAEDLRSPQTIATQVRAACRASLDPSPTLRAVRDHTRCVQAALPTPVAPFWLPLGATR